MNLKEEISEIVLDEGVDLVRFTDAGPFDYALKDSPRRDPHLSLPDARTLIICGIYIGAVPLPDQHDPGTAVLSRLIMSGFYFDVVQPLQKIESLLLEKGFQAMRCDGYAGDSIIPLKLAAIRAGIGWQGKHSLVISPTLGTYLALGGIITDAEIEYDEIEPVNNRCGDCKRCIESCPMQALNNPYQLDVKRCLSYQLEEAKLTVEVKQAMGNRILECDICQEACPFNQRSGNKEIRSNYRWGLTDRFGDLNQFFKMSNLIKLNKEEFDEILGYRMLGVNYDIFRRNLMIAIENA
jgi:epoxyqueuosine reductase